MSALTELTAFARYVKNLREFLRHPLSVDEARRRVEEQLRLREESFLRVLEAGVFAQPSSPYRPLLTAAGVEFGDVVQIVREHGLEGALGRLYDAGVYVTLEEYKGRRPIERLGLSLSVSPEDFFNPLRGPAFVLHDVGSSGVRRGGPLDLVHVAGMAAYQALLFESYDLFRVPYALWFPLPPGRAGLIDALRISKLGKQIDRWFSQTPLELTRATTKPYLLTRATIAASRRWGKPMPRPEHVTLTDAGPVARWLAEKVAQGTPAHLSTYPSSAARACVAAEAAGLDISGTIFRVGGEPYTSAKAEAVERSGSRAISYYGAVETGSIGIACREPHQLDDVHLLTDKLGIIQREREVADGAARVGALVFSTLLATSPRLLLNMESDDYGVLEDRECGCLFGRLGYTRHLHGIHSYDKLTSGGMTFVGSDVTGLLDETLPARFGGAPTDYQLVEEEEAGIPKVSIVVSPRVGELDEAAVIDTVLVALSSGPAYKRMMASVWQSGDTLKVVRREPHATATAKILPLHLVRRQRAH
jgi:hypothetical protein